MSTEATNPFEIEGLSFENREFILPRTSLPEPSDQSTASDDYHEKAVSTIPTNATIGTILDRGADVHQEERPKACDRVIWLEEADRYLGREDNPICNILQKFSGKRGTEYLKSVDRRALELLITIPACIFALPPILILGTIQMIASKKWMIYESERVADIETGESMKIWKLITIKPGNDLHKDSPHLGISIDDLPTAKELYVGIGEFLRKTKLDELPQLYQVLFGRMHLIGYRAVPKEVLDYLKDKWKDKNHLGFKRWSEGYEPSITNAPSVLGQVERDEDRLRCDLVFQRKASLSFDLFLVWKTVIRMLRKI